jgi:hypothetical protein
MCQKPSGLNTEDVELRLAEARASLREGWELAKAAGAGAISDEEIDREIAEVRAARSTPRTLK